jgi:hypothetical protein
MMARADPPGDSLEAWFQRYQQLAVLGVRSTAVAQKIALHLARFRDFFVACYGHERIGIRVSRHLVRRDI